LNNADANLTRQFLADLYPRMPGGLSLVVWSDADKRAAWCGGVDEAAAAVTNLVCRANVYAGASLQDRAAALKEAAARERERAAADGRPPEPVDADYVRGYSETAGAIGAFWAEIDVKGPTHREENLPCSIEDALTVLADTAPTPTWTVFTGGGVQGWWMLEDLWVFEKPADRERAARLMGGWVDTLADAIRARGWQADTAVRDLARVMRVPGTYNRKPTLAQPILVRAEQTDRRYTVEELERLIKWPPPPPIPTTKHFAPRPGQNGSGPSLSDCDKALIALSMLKSFRRDEYRAWLNVGMAMHATDSSRAMCEAWDCWSRQSPKYEEGACAEKWSSFGRRNGRALKLGSLVKWAQEDTGQRDIFTPDAERRSRKKRDSKETDGAADEGEDCNDGGDGVGEDGNASGGDVGGENGGDDESGGDQKRKSQSKMLVELAEEHGVELFHADDVAYASFGVSNDQGVHRETHAVHSKGFRTFLAGAFWKSARKAPGSQAMQDALGVLSAKALFDGPEIPVHIRVGELDGAICYDLANSRWQAVRVTAAGWEVVDDPPIRFIRRRGMQALPVPVAGGSLGTLRRLVNAAEDAVWVMLVSWLVGAMRPHGPYAVLSVNGEQGSAKSTTCRMLRRSIDPNVADLRSRPRDDRDLMIAAANAWVVGFDNLSGIPHDLSDGMCRLATGGGFATRELYTNDDECILTATRPVLLNGIDEIATRPDLIERSLILTLPNIADSCRRDERDLWSAYEAARPRILGALLDSVATAVRNLPGVRLDRPPRMADFATWVVAAESALPWEPGTFLSLYARTGRRPTTPRSRPRPSGRPSSSWWSRAGRSRGRTRRRNCSRSCATTTPTSAPANGRTGPRRPRRWPTRCGVGVTFTRTGRAREITLEKMAPAPSSQSPPSPDAPGDSVSAVRAGVEVTVGDGGVTVARVAPSPAPSPQNPHSDPENGGGDRRDGGDGRSHPRSKAGDPALDMEGVL
jgi:antitoxin (DNA-binding transcriptional repressor) of toxin-antitoxin stability system